MPANNALDSIEARCVRVSVLSEVLAEVVEVVVYAFEDVEVEATEKDVPSILLEFLCDEAFSTAELFFGIGGFTAEAAAPGNSLFEGADLLLESFGASGLLPLDFTPGLFLATEVSDSCFETDTLDGAIIMGSGSDAERLHGTVTTDFSGSEVVSLSGRGMSGESVSEAAKTQEHQKNLFKIRFSKISSTQNYI